MVGLFSIPKIALEPMDKDIGRKIFVNKRENFLKIEFLVTGGFQEEAKKIFY